MEDASGSLRVTNGDEVTPALSLNVTGVEVSQRSVTVSVVEPLLPTGLSIPDTSLLFGATVAMVTDVVDFISGSVDTLRKTIFVDRRA